jgi:hypothetical protein
MHLTQQLMLRTVPPLFVMDRNVFLPLSQPRVQRQLPSLPRHQMSNGLLKLHAWQPQRLLRPPHPSTCKRLRAQLRWL